MKDLLRRAAWSVGLYTFLALGFVATTGFGIYDFGPWRVWIVAAAGALALALSVWQAVGTPDTRAFAGMPALFLLAAGALYGNEGWAADPKLLPLLNAVILGLGATLAAAAVVSILRWRGRRMDPLDVWPATLLAAVVFYTAIIIAIPSPFIDVWYLMNKAGDQLLAGKNPYAIFVPDFYQGRAWYGFDAPGFWYPPAVLYVATLARALGIDVRLLFLVCTVASAALLRATARASGWSRTGAGLLALLFLLVPRSSFMVKYSHSEPVTGLLLAGGFYLLTVRREILGLVVLGAFASSKQYLAVMAPLLFIYCRTLRRSLWLCGGAAVLWVPFALVNPRALWNAVFQVYLDRPARKDALTINGWRMNHGDLPLARWIPLSAGGLLAIGQGLRRRLTLPELAAGMGSVLLVTLFFSPQAFCNYYVLVCWMLLFALATSAPAGVRKAAAPTPAPVAEPVASS